MRFSPRNAYLPKEYYHPMTLAAQNPNRDTISRLQNKYIKPILH